MSKPNIVVIMADQLAPQFCGAYGGQGITPHIDTLAQRGMRFDAAYCNCLLYTSPSPRDATLSRMPSSA